MLYRLCTNTETSRLNIHLGLIEGTHTDIKLDQYEWLAEEDDASSPPPDVTCYLLKQAADTNGLATDVRFFRAGGKKNPDPKKIPDFWSTVTLPTVTEAFKELVEEIDPGIHQFFPINLIIDKTSERVDHTRFYHFICGRFLDIPLHELPSNPGTHDARPLDDDERHRWRTVQERPDIQAYLEQLPIWRFRDHSRRICFINKKCLDAAHERGLKGFKESSGQIGRASCRERV